jgi:hypothetical protein
MEGVDPDLEDDAEPTQTSFEVEEKEERSLDHRQHDNGDDADDTNEADDVDDEQPSGGGDDAAYGEYVASSNNVLGVLDAVPGDSDSDSDSDSGDSGNDSGSDDPVDHDIAPDDDDPAAWSTYILRGRGPAARSARMRERQARIVDAELDKLLHGAEHE